MSMNYKTPNVDPQWTATRETHIAVATAIHAIADARRTPEAIWEAPTMNEIAHVRMAVHQYISNGVFPAEPDRLYPWGQEVIEV